MRTVYRRKPIPEVVRAMFWDGSKEGYHAIREWMPKLLLPGIVPFCQYWEDYAEPLQEMPDPTVYSNAKIYDWTYRCIQFYAWGDDQEMYKDTWVIFYGSEQDDTDEFPVPVGKFMTDKEFLEIYEPVVPLTHEGESIYPTTPTTKETS